tara:strand:+ start:277 stop:513 length:237 start_codon:yes stop_codon:yes gene_type:complete
MPKKFIVSPFDEPKEVITEDDSWKLLAKQSLIDGKPTKTEDEIRAMVGAPSVEESELCECGDKVDECPDAYDHITHGV